MLSNMQKEVKKEAKVDLIKQFIGMLSAFLPVLTVLGINLEWFNEDFISNLNVFLLALLPFVVNIYTIYKNHYSGKQAQFEKLTLKQKGLK